MADKDEDKTENPEAAPAEGAEGAVPAKKFTPKKILLFIVLPLVLLLIIGGAAAFFMGAFDAPPAAEEAAATGEGEATGEEAYDPTKPPAYYTVPDMIVNLQSERSRAVYLKISMSLDLMKEGDIPAVERVMPRVLDNFQVYLRELRVDELRGSAGMYRLREELLMRVNQAIYPIKIKDVLFREMLVQ